MSDTDEFDSGDEIRDPAEGEEPMTDTARLRRFREELIAGVAAIAGIGGIENFFDQPAPD